MLLNIIKQQFGKLKLYKRIIVTNTFFSILAIYIMISLYGLLPNDNFSQKEVLKYVLWAVIIEQALATIRIPLFCKNIRKGFITKYYKFPISIYEQFFFEEIGETIFVLLMNFPVFILGIIFSFKDIKTMIIFMFSLILSLILSVLVALDIYSITFVVWSYKSSKAILTAVSGIFSGAMIPLILLPEWFVRISYYTPFSYMVDFPIQVLLGQNNAGIGIALQCLWIVCLFILGKIIYKILETRITVYGG